MDQGEKSWLRDVVAALKRFQTSSHVTVDQLGAELAHLAWSDRAPTASTFCGARDRFRRHPIAGASELGCSALLMYWPPGHATLPHDHGGHWGIEIVLDGALHVEEFIREGSPLVPRLTKSSAVYLGIGDVALFTEPRYVHRCRNLSNVSGTLTLNVYGGTLEGYTDFEIDSGGLLRGSSRIAVSDAIVG